MKYYSTNKKASLASLQEAVVRGLAPDRGLYMPEKIKILSGDFFRKMPDMSFKEIGYAVADAFFGEDIDPETLRSIVYETLDFDVPVVS
ncbi:MAG: threonine synthase, partial [Dysgonamonadaceae bacterium]|nr:threonine synthase [Dysgonamonadaceae bacterium]